MSDPTPTISFRGIGGDYIVTCQAPNELKCVANWLQETIIAANYAAIGNRVYPGWPPETATLIDPGPPVRPLAFITYRWKSSQPDRTTHGVGSSGARIATLIYEVLVWQQGQSFDGLDDVVEGLVSLLDVGATPRSDGHINGAERYSPSEGSYSKDV